MPNEKPNDKYKERARIMNILYSGLTQEQVESLHKWEVEQSREEGIAQGRNEARCESVDRLVADGTYDAERACEVLGVDIEAYKEYLAGKEK